MESTASTQSPEIPEGADPEVVERVMRNRAKRGDDVPENFVPGESDAKARSEVIRELAEGKKPSEEEALDATEWFLGDDSDLEVEHEIDLNVGTTKKPKWVRWVVRPVDLDTIRRIRQAAQTGTRAQRRAGVTELDEVQANVGIVVAGTVNPDLAALAKQMGSNDPDPKARAAAVLKHRFRHKPGLIGQISGEIMSISGYDDEDVREVDAGKS